MSMLRPAFAYGTSANRDDLNDYLLSRGFYRWDDATETDTDMALLPDRRPVLHRQLAWAEATDFEDHGMQRPTEVPQAFVADQLSSLGPDVAWQAAVVGPMLERVGSVHIVNSAAGDLEEWFKSQTANEGWKPIYRRMDVLRDLDQAKGVLPQGDQPTDVQWLPTTIIRTWSTACDRAQTLRDAGQPFGAIANTLAVEGFSNRHERVTWYPMLAREACEAGQ